MSIRSLFGGCDVHPRSHDAVSRVVERGAARAAGRLGGGLALVRRLTVPPLPMPSAPSYSARRHAMTLYDLKPRFQTLLRPLVRRLAAAGVTANQVTLAAAIGSVALSVLLCCKSHNHALFVLLPVWLALRMALNAIDGMLAREFGQKSRLGGYLNELC